MIKCFIDTVMTIEDISIKKTLKRLCDFWTLYNLDLNMNHLFEGGFINQNQSKMIKNKVKYFFILIKKLELILNNRYLN